MIEWLLKGLEAFGDGEEVLKGRGVNGLKDVVNVQFQVLEPTPGEELTSNGALEQTEGGERKERWVCPITRKELSSGMRAIYLVPCGCAFAESAIKETAAAAGKKEGEVAECLQCGKPYNPRDVININPTTETDITRLQARMKELAVLGLTHSLKGEKSKKRKHKDKENGDMNKTTNVAKDGTKNGTSNGTIKHSATATLTEKVMADQREKTKVAKLEMSDSVKSLYNRGDDNRDRAKGRGGGDFMTRGYSLPKRA